MQARNSRLTAGSDHLGGMLQAGLRYGGAAQHAGHFVRARPLIEEANLSLGASRGFSFVYEEMLIGKSSDLGQMRYTKNLLATRQCLELLPDRLSGPAADADIDLVEDQRARRRYLPGFG